MAPCTFVHLNYHNTKNKKVKGAIHFASRGQEIKSSVGICAWAIPGNVPCCRQVTRIIRFRWKCRHALLPIKTAHSEDCNTELANSFNKVYVDLICQKLRNGRSCLRTRGICWRGSASTELPGWGTKVRS